MDPSTAVVGAAALSAASGAMVGWLTTRVAGRANRTNSMLEWAKQLQASEQAARDRAERIRDEAEEDVARLRSELDELSTKLRETHRLVDRLTDTLTSVQAEVWRPQPDVLALRRLVGRPAAGLNGS